MSEKSTEYPRKVGIVFDNRTSTRQTSVLGLLARNEGGPDAAPRTSLPSKRLSTLADMLYKYSANEPNQNIEVHPSNAVNEINRLQWLISSNLPNISGILLPSDWNELFRPRETIKRLQRELNEVTSDTVEPSRLGRKVHMYDYIRKIALKKVEADTSKKLHIIYNNHIGFVKDSGEYIPTFSPFGWTVEDFVKRRQERNTVWLDMLLNCSEKHLENLKFKCDLEELFKLLTVLFEGLNVDNTNEGQINRDLFDYVHETYEYLKFPQMLKAEAKRNMDRLREQINTYLDFLNYKRGAEEEAHKAALEQELADISIVGPIELRYEINWMHAKTDQSILKITNTLDDMERKANDYRKEESMENDCSRSAINMYYADIEKYKRNISELTSRYDNELEKVENEISYKRISMDKLRDQRKLLEEQMKRFQEEIDQQQQKELEDQMAEEERKREEELRALEEAAAKRAKGKGKGKGKEKGKKK